MTESVLQRLRELIAEHPEVWAVLVGDSKVGDATYEALIEWTVAVWGEGYSRGVRNGGRLVAHAVSEKVTA